MRDFDIDVDNNEIVSMSMSRSIAFDFDVDFDVVAISMSMSIVFDIGINNLSHTPTGSADYIFYYSGTYFLIFSYIYCIFSEKVKTQ